MKLAIVEAWFPDIVGTPNIMARGTATTTPNAIKRAFVNVFKTDRVKRRRFTTIKATITVTELQQEESGGTENRKAAQDDQRQVRTRPKGRR